MDLHKNLKNPRFFAFILILTSSIFAAPGDLDRAFGQVGFKTTPTTGSYDRGYGIVRQPDGKIILVGNRNEDSGSAITLLRDNADGLLDSTFDGDGKVFTQPTISGAPPAISSIAIQPNGKIVGGGAVTNNATQNDVLIARYKPNGAPNASFGTNGFTTAGINGTEQFAYSVELQPDGKIVAVGSSAIGTLTDFAVWRFVGNVVPTLVQTAKTLFDFDGDSKADSSVFRPNNGTWYLQKISNTRNGRFRFRRLSVRSKTH